MKLRSAPLVLALALSLASPAAANGPGSVLIWPVNPVIEGDARAGALWLENPGKAPITLQVRIYAWAQQDGRDVYAEQDEVLGTPPILSIQPGERQLVRLTRTTPPPSVAEKSYRIIVDEVPTADAPQSTGAAVNFRMRYSLPLFSYAASGEKRAKAAELAPALAWRISTTADGRFLEVTNAGAGHARLTEVAFQGEKRATVSEGLYGYVLPGATMRWPLDAEIAANGDLVATINGKAGTRIARKPE